MNPTTELSSVEIRNNRLRDVIAKRLEAGIKHGWCTIEILVQGHVIETVEYKEVIK